MKDLRKLIGKKVLVKAGGLAYSGILVEVNDESVILRSSSGHSEVPVEKVTTIEELYDGRVSSLPPSPLKRKS